MTSEHAFGNKSVLYPITSTHSVLTSRQILRHSKALDSNTFTDPDPSFPWILSKVIDIAYTRDNLLQMQCAEYRDFLALFNKTLCIFTETVTDSLLILDVELTSLYSSR